MAFLPVYFAALQRWEGASLWPARIHLWAPLASSALMAAALLMRRDIRRVLTFIKTRRADRMQAS